MLLTSALIAGGLGANAMIDDQPVTEQTNAPSQTINELKAKEIALDISKGGLVTKTHLIEDNSMEKYEISIVNQDTEFNVDIDAFTGEILN
jgi:uncharacterized membrane protein YkoI